MADWIWSSRKTPPYSPKEAGKLTAQLAQYLVEPLGGQTETKGITSERKLERVLRKGDVIVLSMHYGSLHAVYVPPNCEMALGLRRVTRTKQVVKDGVNSVNIIKINWLKSP